MTPRERVLYDNLSAALEDLDTGLNLAIRAVDLLKGLRPVDRGLAEDQLQRDLESWLAFASDVYAEAKQDLEEMS